MELNLEINIIHPKDKIKAQWLFRTTHKSNSERQHYAS